MANSPPYVRTDPAAGIAGGEVVVERSGLPTKNPEKSRIWFDTEPSHLVVGTPRRALALVPKLKKSGRIEVSFSSGEDHEPIAKSAPFMIGKTLAEDLHPVANPAFDPDDGSLFVTRSGSRGEHISVTIFRISGDGEVSEFSGDITNPTGIAFDKRGQMFVTSRLDGTVYRVTPLNEVVAFAADLGIATGLAFDQNGEMHVGDRSGTIYRVNEIGEARPWAQVEPSVSAFHLAFGPDGALYLAGPTVSGFDVITRIDEHGQRGVFYRGLGRPQGLAFDRQGNLYVAASLHGRRGIVQISPDAGNAEIVVAGMNLVGLAFSAKGEMVVATNEAVYSLPLGIYGILLD
jgi:sugar lactone lactonase YvrE